MGSPVLAPPSAPPSRESAGTPEWRSQAATPSLSLVPFWQMTTAERPANSLQGLGAASPDAAQAQIAQYLQAEGAAWVDRQFPDEMAEPDDYQDMVGDYEYTPEAPPEDPPAPGAHDEYLLQDDGQARA